MVEKKKNALPSQPTPLKQAQPEKPEPKPEPKEESLVESVKSLTETVKLLVELEKKRHDEVMKWVRAGKF